MKEEITQVCVVGGGISGVSAALSAAREGAKVTLLEREYLPGGLAMIHPIESYWCVYGPDDQTSALRERLEKQFSISIEWLLFGQIDFDFAAESLLCEQEIHTENGILTVGRMQYEAVIVPPLVSIRQNTLDVLRRFAAEGGKVIVMGNAPEYVEAKPNSDTDIPGARHIGFDRYTLLDALETERDVFMGVGRSIRSDCLLYQLREDEDESWLFAAVGRDADPSEKLSFFVSEGNMPMLSVGIRGIYDPELCDCMDGSISALTARYENGWTWISLPFYDSDSVLLHLIHRRQRETTEKDLPVYGKPIYLDRINSFKTDEKNLIPLDIAMYSLDGGPWRGREEILRLDNIIRAEVGYQKRTDAFLQPWITGGKNPIEHTVRLRYDILSELRFDEAYLAVEPECTINLNGREIISDECGYFVDRAIRLVKLSGIEKGQNTLELEIPFGPRTNLESCFLLGNFGVRVQGEKTVLTEYPNRIGFGPLSTQGLPFFGGNITYELSAELPEDGCYTLTVPRFAGALADVSVDGGNAVPIVCEPYRAELGKLSKGLHSVSLTCYGSRVNTFGQLHNCSDEPIYYGPNSWRSEGSKWSYSYQLRPTGILASCYIQKQID